LWRKFFECLLRYHVTVILLFAEVFGSVYYLAGIINQSSCTWTDLWNGWVRRVFEKLWFADRREKIANFSLSVCSLLSRLAVSEIWTLSLGCTGKMLSFVSAVFQKPYSTINCCRRFLIKLWQQVFALIIFCSESDFFLEKGAAVLVRRNLWGVRIGEMVSNTRWKTRKCCSPQLASKAGAATIFNYILPRERRKSVRISPKIFSGYLIRWLQD